MKTIIERLRSPSTAAPIPHADLCLDAANTIDALATALERISRDAKDRCERAWFRLETIADEADAALALVSERRSEPES